MKNNKLLFLYMFFWVIGCCSVYAQATVDVRAFLDTENHLLEVESQLVYKNDSPHALKELYLNDWAHAYASKETPLADHFASEYIRKFHFAKEEERGRTQVQYLQDKEGGELDWSRPEEHPDILQVQLKEYLKPGDSIRLNLAYRIRIPSDKFTGFGVEENGDYDLRYWLISPSVYQDNWQIYSHKNLGDQYHAVDRLTAFLKIPKSYRLYSELNQEVVQEEDEQVTIYLQAEKPANFRIKLTQNADFYSLSTPFVELLSDIDQPTVIPEEREEILLRVLDFLEHNLGAYPNEKIMVTLKDYKTSPIYGLNQLPKFLRPFPDSFQYQLMMVKTLARKYIQTGISINARKEAWLLDGMEIYLLMKYVEEYYPETKLIGKLSEFIGFRWTHLAELDFNKQYSFLFLNMNRLNLDQKLSMRKDSLVRFNRLIANPYKAGAGFRYLEDFLEDQSVTQSIKEFYEKGREVEGSTDFINILKEKTEKDIDWFLEDYVNTNVRIDFKLKKIEREGDSIKVYLKNKEDNTMPVSVYALDNKYDILAKYWYTPTADKAHISIPYDSRIKRIGLNSEQIIPEYNSRDNFKKRKGILNKPVQFRLLTDAEDPRYHQVFFMPQFGYNLYDGFTLGSRISNNSLLYKHWNYQLSPQYGFLSKSWVGNFLLTYQQQFRNQNLSSIRYHLNGTRFSYDRDLYYHKFSPFVQFTWRHRDLRNKERQYLTIRNVNVRRDFSENRNELEQPDYNVLDLRYTYSNQSMKGSVLSSLDIQMGPRFTKTSLTAKYRKLWLNNQQIEFRFFGGLFIKNHTSSDYFSFALDRPTDYLFDYNYYGRSESSGLFSQQFIESEGGFKSKLDPAFANQWLTSFNSSLSFWKDYAYVYGDVGIVKNRGHSGKIRYDSGLRLSAVQDYFEVFFPVYSNLGWEIGASDYKHRIRFIVTLDLQTLLGLFERSFY